MVCISVSPVPPDFEIATKRVVASGSRSSSVAKVSGIEIVHEVQARPVAQRADARRPRGPASCASVWPPRLEPPVPSKHDVARAVAQSRGGSLDRGEIVGLVPAGAAAARPPSAWRARSQSSAAVACAASVSSSVARRDAVAADAFFARVVDRLDDGHRMLRRRLVARSRGGLPACGSTRETAASSR